MSGKLMLQEGVCIPFLAGDADNKDMAAGRWLAHAVRVANQPVLQADAQVLARVSPHRVAAVVVDEVDLGVRGDVTRRCRRLRHGPRCTLRADDSERSGELSQGK